MGQRNSNHVPFIKTWVKFPKGMQHTSDYYFFLPKRNNNKIIFATMLN